MNKIEKDSITMEIVSKLSKYPSLRKIILFGSFLTSEYPNDIDIAVLDDSEKDYITLATDYRLLIYDLARKHSIDLIPLHSLNSDSHMIRQINLGSVVYEK